VVRAKLESRCYSCFGAITVGSDITKTSLGWVHRRCADGTEAFERNRRLVLSEETYASKTPNTWRLGRSPGSTRAAR
jgi:hypothetical protein